MKHVYRYGVVIALSLRHVKVRLYSVFTMRTLSFWRRDSASDSGRKPRTTSRCDMMQSRSSSGSWASRQKLCSFVGLIIVLREEVAGAWSRIETRESWGSRLVVDGCVPSHHRQSRAAFEFCKKAASTSSFVFRIVALIYALFIFWQGQPHNGYPTNHVARRGLPRRRSPS
jgi:hypothetical protein